MRKNLILSFSVISSLALTSCSKLGPLSADNFTVTPNPLEVTANQVPATIDARFPVKYMKKKAVVTIIPELRYGSGQVAVGERTTFQGEKVRGNDQVVPYRAGGNYSMKTSFSYVPEMLKSELYLTFDARKGKKRVNLPAVKVADGVVSTSQLYKRTMLNDGLCLAPDTFQRVKAQKQEANIKFLINQANLRKSELKNNSIAEFVRMLKNINNDREKLNLRNVEVSAYASPDGGFALNDKLANKRQNTGEEYVKGQLKQNKVQTNIDAHYTAQDWEGFQKLVQASNIQDKDVILRVLSMYKDPQEREQQIRNMSVGFRELATGILPELRRARLIINYEVVGRSDEQIQQQFAQDASKLSADEILYGATLTNNASEAMNYYRKATELYPNDYRAYNNLGILAMQMGNDEQARTYFRNAVSVDANAAEPNANLGLLALKSGNLQEAENLIAKAGSANDINKAVGTLNIAKGNYALAEQNLKGYDINTAALAQLLNRNYAGATATLKNVKHPDAMTDYLTAVVNARQGNTSAAAQALQSAVKKDPSLASYAADDFELAKVEK
ncbi:tetratricopeptide repeat protein [Hoylesella saccharolytica]|uniref:tetratricopeptide repeat protein n=1 Tax=Hoylesella saccharolytica TaxID=633701 RepID=UPI0028D0DCA9|nr:tetratricopeptide repeat protein [Hoylesella saccharolytica]